MEEAVKAATRSTRPYVEHNGGPVVRADRRRTVRPRLKRLRALLAQRAAERRSMP